jgi:hypothetical protein
MLQICSVQALLLGISSTHQKDAFHVMTVMMVRMASTVRVGVTINVAVLAVLTSIMRVVIMAMMTVMMMTCRKHAYEIDGKANDADD